MAKQTFTTGQVLTAAQMNSLQSNDFNQTVSVKTASYTLVAADKGTRIEFNTSGSVTCTVNTGLFDAGDTLIIQNRGAGAVTVTAGTATVNTSATLVLSQYDSGTLYFISASAAIFFNTDAGGGSPLTTKGDIYVYGSADSRLPIGTNNYVLTADSSESLGMKWAAVSSTPTFVGCRVYHIPAQSIANSTTTSLVFETESFDTDGFHSNTINSSRITIPSGKDGKYLFTGHAMFAANSSGQRILLLAKNGTDYDQIRFAPLATQVGSVVTGIIDCVAGDYVELRVEQSSGGSLNVNGSSHETSFACTYLGA